MLYQHVHECAMVFTLEHSVWNPVCWGLLPCHLHDLEFGHYDSQNNMWLAHTCQQFLAMEPEFVDSSCCTGGTTETARCGDGPKGWCSVSMSLFIRTLSANNRSTLGQAEASRGLKVSNVVRIQQLNQRRCQAAVLPNLSHLATNVWSSTSMAHHDGIMRMLQAIREDLLTGILIITQIKLF